MVKYHTFCWLPATEESWSSWLPGSSFAPVVSTTLNLVLPASNVEDVPKGFRVAFKRSVLPLMVTLVIWVAQLVDVVEVHLKSLKVEVVMVVGSILSEKVAVALVPRATPVPVGVTVLTLGAVESTLAVVKDQL